MHHYLIVAIIIVFIVIIQFRFFANTKRKISNFLCIFPPKNNDYTLEKEMLIEKINSANDEDLSYMLTEAGLNSEKYLYTRTNTNDESILCFRREQARKDLINLSTINVNGIHVNYNNATLTTIVNSINDYLRNNKSVNDFHLLKDIVDRNCDAKEEEINTQIPIPLYMGLVGTMAGILVGIGFLVFNDGLNALLNTDIPQRFRDIFPKGTVEEIIEKAWSAKGSEGVIALMGGVSIAMISSIFGIILTTWASNKFRTAKSVVESKKHAFLSWIQAKLLPTLSDNVVGAIREMTENLNDFNNKFAANTGNLGMALEKVNESYRLQTQLLDSVKQIADKDLTQQNLKLYTALKNSTAEIAVFAEYLQNCNQYIATVKALNDNLALQENRTRTIEEVGAFFKTELTEIEARKSAISKTVGVVDNYLKDALEKLKENSEFHLNTINKTVGVIDDCLKQALEKLKENADAQFSELQKSTVKQEDILQRKAKEIETVVTELKQLSAIKESISKFEQAMRMQNSKLDNLANAIRVLAEVKAEGVNFPSQKTQIQKKILIGVGSALGGLLLLALLIANWDSIYSNFIKLFKF